MGLERTTCRRLLVLALAGGIGVLVSFANVIRLQTAPMERRVQVVSSTSSSTSEETCADILVSNAGPFDGLYSSFGNDEINDRFVFTCQRERGCETELPPGMQFLLDEDAEASYSYEYQPPDDSGNPGVYGDYLEVYDGVSHPVSITEEWTGTFDGTRVAISCAQAIVSDTSSSTVVTPAPSLGAVADPATSSPATSTSSAVDTTSPGARWVPNNNLSTLFCVLLCAAAML